jgi:hypothetical protein
VITTTRSARRAEHDDGEAYTVREQRARTANQQLMRQLDAVAEERDELQLAVNLHNRAIRRLTREAQTSHRCESTLRGQLGQARRELAVRRRQAANS